MPQRYESLNGSFSAFNYDDKGVGMDGSNRALEWSRNGGEVIVREKRRVKMVHETAHISSEAVVNAVNILAQV